MFEANQTKVTEFTMLGFHNLPILKPLMFLLFLLIYILILTANLMIIILVAKAENLNSPMYFFLCQLSMTDILLTTDIVPYLLHVTINGETTISLPGCITQLFIYGVSASGECLLLTVMSYDRYLAICQPLSYTSVMDPRLRFQLVFWAWFLPFLAMLIIVIFVSKLQFCGPRVIDHYFCDLAPVLELSCSNYNIPELVDFVAAILFVLAPFFFILFTYTYIFITIFGISSTKGKKKSFSTCSSHLIVVSTYYGTLMSIYMAPSKEQSSNINKVISILYTMVTPFFNPIVYTLRNKEIKRALMKFLSTNNKM